MAETQDQDKSEKATPFKLKEAHKKGQVAKSMEVNSFLSLLVFTACFLALSASMGESLVHELRRIFLSAGQLSFDQTIVENWLANMLVNSFASFSPLFLALVVTAVLATILQTKPVFSTFPLKPDFKRLHPVQGFKKIFSLKTLYELFKSLFKLLCFGVLIYWGVNWLTNETITLYQKNPWLTFSHLLSLFAVVAFTILGILLPIALVDLLFTRWEFAKKMRMSRREVKDEYKRREGHPEVKSKQKEIQRELLKKATSLGQVKDSDVIITNPTHFAVALKYDPKKMIAPTIVAMGRGPLAWKIKKLAFKYRKPVVRNPKLARRLYRLGNLEQPIPNETYGECAPIFRWVFTANSTDNATGKFL
ncbi:MAG: EscU/YscU/HrcU family type III secretion system export apparatus switch protein [Pseudomonadota bacterium]